MRTELASGLLQGEVLLGNTYLNLLLHATNFREDSSQTGWREACSGPALLYS